MARHVKALLHANELEETRTRPQQVEEDHSQGETDRPEVSMKSLQRAMSRPGQTRPQDMRLVSQTYGNKAVMRLVEKARLDRQAVTAPIIQRQPIAITVQRVGDNENDQDPQVLKLKYKSELKEQKKKKTRLLGGKGVANMFRQLLTLPVRVIDQLTVADLHLGDLKEFIKTKKTRKQRNKERVDVSQEKKNRGDTKRVLGRSGLYGYLHGIKSHNSNYGVGNGDKLPVLGSKFNPLKALGNVNTDKIKAVDRQIKMLEDRIWQIDHPGEDKYAVTGDLK